MSYNALESSRQKGQPIQLYKFKYGVGVDDCYTYTDGEDEITYDDGDGEKVYAPIPISRGAVVSSGSLDKAKLDVRLSADTEIGTLYKNYPPSFIVTLIIRAFHAEDSDHKVVWSGVVRGGGPQEDEIVLTCEPISTQMKRNGLRRNYQYGCPLVLYGEFGCKADKDYATVTGTVAAFTNSTVTLDSGWNGTFPPEKFAGGIMEWINLNGNKEIRMINKGSGDTLTIKGALRDIRLGLTVTAILGCGHTEDDCSNLHRESGTLHSNINNYGGQSWIPTDNPIRKNQSY